jgi:hypothetical protein
VLADGDGRGRDPRSTEAGGLQVIVLDHRRRTVVSFAAGTHYPAPYVAPDGLWRCHDCGRTLTRYLADYGVRRLRHNPRDRR